MSLGHPMSESDDNDYESPYLEKPRKKVFFCVSKLQWHSAPLTQVMHSTDQTSERRRSAIGHNNYINGCHTQA